MTGAMCIIFVLFYALLTVHGAKEPISIAQSAKAFLKPAIGAAALAGLVAGKQILNGPSFTEDVTLSGKNIVITGANTGLGKATAMKLASLGGSVILLCKTASRGNAAADEIRLATGNPNVQSIQMDLSDLSSVSKVSQKLHQDLNHIDVLVNNAGVMALPSRTVTQDNFEAHIGINHLGHFALTGQLLDLLQRSPSRDARVVTVASHAHLFGKLEQDNLMLDKPGSYQPWPAYGNSKLANILFTKEFARRLGEKKDDKLVAVCCHPGLCRTDLGRYMFDMEAVKPIATLLAAPIWYSTKSSEEGAQTQIFLSASSQISRQQNGEYFDNSSPATPSPLARDEQMGRWLWGESERLTGVKFNV